MKILRHCPLILALSFIIACDQQNKPKIPVVAPTSKIITGQQSYGFIITDQNSPFNIPSQFTKIRQYSKALINSNWISSEHFLFDINNLIYLFSTTNLPQAEVFISALKESRYTYKKNMIEINIIRRKLQHEVDKKISFYNNKLKSTNNKLNLLTQSEQDLINKVESIKKEIAQQQKYYTELRRSFKKKLEQTLNDKILVSKINSDLEFRFKKNNTGRCTNYFGDYHRLLLPSSEKNCIYYNKYHLLESVPNTKKVAVTNLFNQYIPLLWNTMIHLTGYFESNNNYQISKNHLQKQLVEARFNLNTFNSYKSEQKIAQCIKHNTEKLHHLNSKIKSEINHSLIDSEFNVDISSIAFKAQLSQLIQDKKISNPIKKFIRIYNDKYITSKFIHAYSNKIISEYPKELTFLISKNDNLFLPKIERPTKRIIIEHNDNHCISYYSKDGDITADKIKENKIDKKLLNYNIENTINNKLYQLWYS